MLLLILIFGAGAFLAGWGLGRWAIEPLIDELAGEYDDLTSSVYGDSDT